jgi:hypothetical protein
MKPAFPISGAGHLRGLLLATALLATVTGPAQGQRLARSWPQGPTPSLTTAAAPSPAAGIPGSDARDYRYEGLYVGLGAGAAFSIWNAGKCSGRHDCLSPSGFGLLITALGGLVGALLGGMIPK